MKRIDKVYNKLLELCRFQYSETGEVKGISAIDMANQLDIQRTNASSDLNQLFKENRIEKIEGKPVLYRVKERYSKIPEKNREKIEESKDAFQRIKGSEHSLKNAVQQARAAIIYPPNGLHTLLFGETGTGKSMFAEAMYEYAKHIGRIEMKAPFVIFNCADYANNPQLLMSHLFGVKKGAYTGADKDRSGLVEKADGGVLFLDEVHRLPPEGQEMLFYLIDKGLYRNLGETENLHRANVLIICATTENADTSLLKTFTRRIPMVIKLPALRDRSFIERLELTKHFFRIEASAINANIVVSANAIKAFLLYDCPNNIGQLKSDIKLCCAKSFLGSMIEKKDSVFIRSGDLLEYIRRGLFKYKENKERIDEYVGRDVIVFSAGEDEEEFEMDTKTLNIYESMEEKRKSLEEKGIDEKDIKLIMSLEMESYIKKYISGISKSNLQELYKVVNEDIVDMVDRFLRSAEEKLNKQFSEKVLFSLSMHVGSSMERIITGKTIENHQLGEIKSLYSREFEAARELGLMLEGKFNVKIPEDEIGFVTMFLSLFDEEKHDKERVGILIAMHGESAATSIADVANRLLGEEHAVGYNMPLTENPEVALRNITDMVKRMNQKQGVLLLVDMGSLTWFGDTIFEETGIPVKTVEMVSTPIVLEATRKAILNAPLSEIYESTVNLSPYVGRIYKESVQYSGGLGENVIITACITGEGTALKLKNILESRLNLRENNVDVIPMDINTREGFKRKIEKVKQEKNLIAVVSSFDPEDDSVLFLSTADLFSGNKISQISERICLSQNLEIIDNMKAVVMENSKLDAEKYISCFKEFYNNLSNYGLKLDDATVTGLLLHVLCVLERVLNGKELIHFEERKILIEKHKDELKVIKRALKPFEQCYDLEFSDEECINIVMSVYLL